MELIKDSWKQKNIHELVQYLESQSDLKFKTFNDKIINTKSRTIGVQIPKLRIVANNIAKGNYISFLRLSMPDIFELHIIYGLLLTKIKDNDIAYPIFATFIKSIDNWAVCDIFCGDYKIVNANKDFYLNKIKTIVKSDLEFEARVGIILLMKYYINDNDIDMALSIINTITLDKYYVNMGIAWMLSMSYIKYQDATLNFINKSKLNYFTKNKTYQKILESRQITPEDRLKIKELKSKLKQ